MEKNYKINKSGGSSLMDDDVYRILEFKNIRDLIFFLECLEKKVEKERINESFMGIDVAKFTLTFLTEKFVEHIESHI